MNPLLALAHRLATGQLAPDELSRELQSFIEPDGIDGAVLNDAVGTVITMLTASPPAPVPFIVATVQVTGAILTAAGEKATLRQVLLAAAEHLGQRLENPADMVSALTTAAHFYELAHRFTPAIEPRSGAALMNEANTWQHLAATGIETEANYRKAIDLYANAASCFPEGSLSAGLCRMNEATSWQRLADVGIEPEASYRKAIALCAQAAPCIPEGSLDAGGCRMQEANAWQRLANVGVEPAANYRKAIGLYAQAAPCFPEGSSDAGCCLTNEAAVWQRLADMGIERENNYRRAIALYAQAAPCIPEGSPNAGCCRMGEAITWLRLAEVGIEPETNLRKAIGFFAQAESCFAEGSPDVGKCRMHEAMTWQRLAEVGIEPEDNLRKAIALYAQAVRCFPDDSPSAGRCRMSEATAWQCRAELEGQGHKAGKSLAKAVQLHEAALPCFGEDTFDRAKVAHNFAGVLHAQAMLAGSNDERVEKLRRARALLREEAGQIVERIGGTFRDETERRAFRETFQSIYRQIVTVCLDLATLEENAEQAEALRWEAWQWVQRAKARTLQESLAFFQTAAIEHDPALAAEFDAVLAEFSKFQDELRDDTSGRGDRDEPGGEPRDAAAIAKINDVLARLLPPAGTEAVVPSVPARNHFITALSRLGSQDRPVVVVEFFPAENGKFGIFLHRGGEAHGLREPVWLEGGCKRALKLARACDKATAILAKQPRRRARDRVVNAEELPQEVFADAADALDGVAAELGTMLAPLREAIAGRGWHDATLVFCPTGVLHLLPLAAAHWGVEADGTPRPLIAAHPLIHLPTAALAVEVARRERALTAKNRIAYVAAADRSNKLKAIYKEAADVKTNLEARGFAVRDFSKDTALARTLWADGPEAWIVHLAMHTGSHERFELCGVEFQDRRLLVLELLVWLRLRHAALAVVATCSSSQAHAFDLAADDPSALTRAWMLAGAQSVLGGLWPLDDSAAAEFSKVFYEEWAGKGAPLAEAVQAAILTVRETRGAEDVFAWAPFVLVGHGATVIA